ncbi:hypothetical protein GX48_05484 [Paracoccidioides brasiliensis]|nr:hypothetical protein GX48_05484 [Paracoccidioides brasiliensis]
MPGRAGYFCAASSDTSSKKIDRSRSGVACATRPWRLLREMNDSPNRKGNNPKSQPQLGVTGVSGTRIRDTKREQLGDEREKLSWEHIDQEQIYKTGDAHHPSPTTEPTVFDVLYLANIDGNMEPPAQ